MTQREPDCWFNSRLTELNGQRRTLFPRLPICKTEFGPLDSLRRSLDITQQAALAPCRRWPAAQSVIISSITCVTESLRQRRGNWRILCVFFGFFFQQTCERGRVALEVWAHKTCRRDDSPHGCVHFCRLAVEEEEDEKRKEKQNNTLLVNLLGSAGLYGGRSAVV